MSNHDKNKNESQNIILLIIKNFRIRGPSESSVLNSAGLHVTGRAELKGVVPVPTGELVVVLAGTRNEVHSSSNAGKVLVTPDNPEYKHNKRNKHEKTTTLD